MPNQWNSCTLSAKQIGISRACDCINIYSTLITETVLLFHGLSKILGIVSIRSASWIFLDLCLDSIKSLKDHKQHTVFFLFHSNPLYVELTKHDSSRRNVSLFKCMKNIEKKKKFFSKKWSSREMKKNI